MVSAARCRMPPASPSALPSWSARGGPRVGTVFITYQRCRPSSRKYAGIAYLVYLAVHIAMSGRLRRTGQCPRADDVLGAAMFQWINAKGWVMVIGTITAYAIAAPGISHPGALSLLLGTLSCRLGGVRLALRRS
jgi:hypothetical protein